MCQIIKAKPPISAHHARNIDASGASKVIVPPLLAGSNARSVVDTSKVTGKLGTTEIVPLEIGVSAYSDADSAAHRIQFTINDQRNQGATPTEVTLGDNVKGTLLISGAASLAVFAKGTATVAITLSKDSGIKGDAAKDPLTKIATAVAAHLP